MGLRCIHERSYLHRDIKLENVVFGKIDDLGTLKLIDFGLAVSLNDPIAFSVCGTPGYIAPEILQFEEPKPNVKFSYSPKIDLFGVGVILYRL